MSITIYTDGSAKGNPGNSELGGIEMKRGARGRQGELAGEVSDRAGEVSGRSGEVRVKGKGRAC